MNYVNDYLISPFEACQYEIKNTFDPIDSDLVYEVAKRVFVVATYPILGIGYLVGRVILACSEVPPAKPGRILKAELHRLKADRKAGWQEASIKLIRKSRQDHVHREIERLKDAGILDSTTERSLDHSLS